MKTVAWFVVLALMVGMNRVTRIFSRWRYPDPRGPFCRGLMLTFLAIFGLVLFLETVGLALFEARSR
jgi:hypothetical protein